MRKLTNLRPPAPVMRASLCVLPGAVLCLAATRVLAGADSPVPSGAGGTVFYTAAVTIIGVFFLINLALKNRIGVAYSVLFVLILTLVWMLEGGLAQLAPTIGQHWLRALPMMLGLITSAYGFHVARGVWSPGSGTGPLPRILAVAMYGALVLVPVAIVAPGGVLASLVNLLLMGMIGALALATLTWRTHDGGRQTTAIGAGVSVVAILIVLYAVFELMGLGEGARALALRGAFSVVTLLTMAAVIMALADVRRARDAAQAAALRAAQQDAETSRALLEMEQNYARAREVAARRTRDLSTASHDLRQPLASMRAELDALREGISQAPADRLSRILEHLDTLTRDLLHTAEHTTETNPGAPPATAEPLPIEVVLTTLDRMFESEARARAVALRVIPSTRTVLAPPLVLMRIASNLIANALAHARARRVLVGVRRRGDHLRLEILDDGTGFTAQALEDAFEEGAKGEGSDGSGLGLSIVRDLCREHGLELLRDTRDGKGSRFGVCLPLAEGDTPASLTLR